MSWREQVNTALLRLTGYQLSKPAAREPATPRPDPEAERRRARKRAHKQKYALHADFDDASKRIITTVKRRTMTSSDKLYALISATRYVVRHRIPGAIVECGVWRGGSMQAVALSLQGEGVDDRDLYLFDTFEGMPPPSDEDRRYDGAPAAELLATSPKTAGVWAIAGLDDVKQAMAETGYPTERIHYVEGMVEDTVPAAAPDQIAILRLDTDWYSSTAHELEHLYPRLSSGGVLIIDDYGWWEGARKATEEFLDKTGERLLLLRASGGRVAVKP